MNTTILLIGHGSRAETGNQEVESFASQWREKNPHWNIEVCFIEFADVLLKEGLAKAAAGAKRVIAVPLILNAAAHVKLEIPEAIDEARTDFPEVTFIYAKHLGVTEEIRAVMHRRLNHVVHQLKHPDPKTTGVILLGRGSSDMVANSEVAKLARQIFEKSEHDLVEIAFTGITYPRLETVVQRQVRLGMMQVIVLPYYLFDGRLIQRIKEQVEVLEGQYPQVRFGQGDYIGFEAEIFQLMNQRVTSCLEDTPSSMMECDGCPYKEASPGGHHHHHETEHQPTCSHAHPHGKK